jgi:hypothetical protein
MATIGFNQLLASAALLFLSGVAMAEPPSNADPLSPLGRWYRSLMIPNTGSSCCSVSDCRPVEAQQVNDGWQIKVGGIWLPVRPELVLNRDNPDGRPIACMAGGVVFCFVPPAGT